MNRQGLWGQWPARVLARLVAAAVLAAGIAALLILGALSLRGAMASMLAVALWVIFWPRSLSADRTIPSSPGPALTPLSMQARDTDIWKQMIAVFGDPILVLDSHQHIIFANAAARAMFPVRERQPIAQVRRDPDLLSAVERALDTGRPQSFDLRMVLPVERRLAGTATPMKSDASASQPALLVVMHDRTEVEQLAQMRADFVANASHELRTPLASLQGFVETMQGAAKDDPAARDRFLDIMAEQAARMSRLIDDLLSLSRIEMRAHVAPTTVVDLAGVTNGVVQALAPIAKEAGISIACEPNPAGVPVFGDRDELVQVVQNLIQNAIKYGRQGGHVTVSLTPKGSRVALAIADDGIGIAPQHLPRLTERFYRVSAKDSRERGGTGLGLAIVKHIVNRYRGELRIASAPGKGSTFTVLLHGAAAAENNEKIHIDILS